jgi:hypothetical protein
MVSPGLRQAPTVSSVEESVLQAFERLGTSENSLQLRGTCHRFCHRFTLFPPLISLNPLRISSGGGGGIRTRESKPILCKSLITLLMCLPETLLTSWSVSNFVSTHG